VILLLLVFVQRGQVLELYYQVSDLLVLSQILLVKSQMAVFVALPVHLM